MLPLPDDQISDAMRDYLAEIYRLSQGDVWVSTTALSDRLTVSGPATVRMVRRLHNAGLVDHLPYKGVKLTPPGRRVALLHIRRRRLAECFLVDMLQFGWHEIHEQAETMHKGINKVIENRIDFLLNHPATCPHGDPIPGRDGTLPKIDDVPLTVIPAGAKGTISRVKTREPEKLKYLAQIGLIPNTPFELLNRAPFNGPLRLKTGRIEQIIGAELAAALWVLCPQRVRAAGKKACEKK